nr:carbon storage regulator [uncultured Oscillibacter sp.]
MLVLAVKQGDYLVLGEDVVVQVAEIGNVIRLAIQAPKDMPVLRGGVYEETYPTPPCVVRQRRKLAERQEEDRFWYLSK